MAQVQTVTPTTFADGSDTQGCTPDHCTLREAVGEFSSQRVVNLRPGTYELTASSPLHIQGTKTINGAGATIDANGQSRVIDVVEGADAIINDVTITGGNADAGQSFPQSGGGIGIDVATTLSLNRSTVTGNHAGSNGGGIFNGGNGPVVITDSTISNNTVGVTGTGGRGAGVYADSGSDLEIVNSTISGNRTIAGRIADGAALAVLGALQLVHVTIAANVPAGTDPEFPGSSLAIPPNPNQTPLLTAIWNTIVVAETGRACLIGRMTSGDHNLDDDGTCGFSRVGDKPGSNPLLGPLQNNGGRTATHALAANSPAVAGADVPHCRPTDQRGVARPQQGACDIGAFEYLPPPPPQPGPPPPPNDDEELPPPVAGKSVNALPKSGRVRIKLPGTRRFVRLMDGQQVPVGTVFDTRKGHVTLVAAANRQGGTATSEFWAGIFRLNQTKRRRPITTLTLTERLSCPKAGKAMTAAKRTRRRLWGDGSGRFRTKGRHSAATVVGTRWLVEDRCRSTLTRVVRGRVSVRDFVKKKTVIIRRGKRYIARAKPR